MQKPQDLFVDLLIDRLTLWQELTVDDACDMKNVINVTLTFDFDCLAFFGLGDVGDFH